MHILCKTWCWGCSHFNAGSAKAEFQSLAELLSWVFKDSHLYAYLKVNSYNDILWFNQESFIRFNWWLAIISLLSAVSSKTSEADLVENMIAVHTQAKMIHQAEKKSQFQVKRLLENLTGSTPASA